MRNLQKISISLIAVFTLSGVIAKQAPLPSSDKQDLHTVHKEDENKIRVAVIDTGIAEHLLKHKSLCKSGHKDFTGTGIVDIHGHGSHVSGLIDENVNKVIAKKKSKLNISYCQVILKFYHSQSTSNPSLNMLKALRHAIDIKVDVINISGGGNEFIDDEKKLIVEALNAGIVVIAAAGNDGLGLASIGQSIEKKDKNKMTNYYPAQADRRVIVVGNGINSEKRSPTSNYGDDVDVWEDGNNVLSYGTSSLFKIRLSGTSQSTAIFTGKIIGYAISK